MFILLLFPCCFAQGGTIFDPDDNIQGAESMDLSSFMSFIIRKLSTVLNNDILQKISNMAEDIEEIKGEMKDMKEAIDAQRHSF